MRSAGVTDGYVNTARDGRFLGDWFSMGDLGYMADGELFVTGRSSEVIIPLGLKYHPEDIEQAVQSAAGVPPGRCVAFSPAGGRQEDLVVVVEVGDEQEDLTGVVSAAIVNAVGLAPSQVLLVPTGSLPTTPNGSSSAAAPARCTSGASSRRAQPTPPRSGPGAEPLLKGGPLGHDAISRAGGDRGLTALGERLDSGRQAMLTITQRYERGQFRAGRCGGRRVRQAADELKRPLGPSSTEPHRAHRASPKGTSPDGPTGSPSQLAKKCLVRTQAVS